MSEPDDELFFQEMKDVKPMTSDRVGRTTANDEPSMAQLARRAAAIGENVTDPNKLTTDYLEMVGPYDLLEFKRGGVQDGVYRKLRLGKYDSEAALDLHRKSVEQARREVFEFINDCSKFGLRSVMILHGKGERSDPPALLKSYVNKWLPDLPQVMAFHSAQAHHGGYGAVYVLLKKSDAKKQENRERHLNRR